jgi:hypothetical protein
MKFNHFEQSIETSSKFVDLVVGSSCSNLGTGRQYWGALQTLIAVKGE